ncbi:hypothetical protein NQ314_018707 [Rhamnusium bicolor]|uniref:DUF4371 domain-containing protein n=1 Tax=Rhamnusium bicolor TaxID=1586634 RepID=A0AAV8WQ10_9CUCU|nr:hypothetical protein NQ314_018707 [Rhamnusium bicolor]
MIWISTNKTISEEIKSALMLDETKHVSKLEQLPVVVRYYFNGTIYERFLGFICAEKLDARSLFSYVEKILGMRDIDMNYCVCQTYDGASVMSGVLNGVQALFTKGTSSNLRALL